MTEYQATEYEYMNLPFLEVEDRFSRQLQVPAVPAISSQSKSFHASQPMTYGLAERWSCREKSSQRLHPCMLHRLFHGEPAILAFCA